MKLNPACACSRTWRRPLLQDHAKAVLSPVSATAFAQTLTAAIIEAGAIKVLEPGFAHLLNMLPSQEDDEVDVSRSAGGATAATGVGKASAGGQKEGPRRAMISRCGFGFHRGGMT